MSVIECKCKGCGRKPHEINEYKEMVECGEYETAEQAVRCNEGTYNPSTGAFYCTICYVKAGMPMGMA